MNIIDEFINNFSDFEGVVEKLRTHEWIHFDPEGDPFDCWCTICNKDAVDIVYNKDGKDDFLKILPLTCDEAIIKNIIE